MATTNPALRPGQSVEISRSRGLRVVLERSGDGRTLRLVRESRDGYTVVWARPACQGE